MRAAARELAGRPGVAFAEPDWIRRVDACDPEVCWHLQPRPGANVLQVHQGGATGVGRTVAVVDTGVVSGVGDLDGQVLTCGGGDVGSKTAGPHFEAEVRGIHLLDVYSTGSSGDYRLTWTLRNAAGLPIEVAVPACSPNGDGVKDRCAWSAGAIAGSTITSFVTSGAASAARRAGGGAHAWDGGDSAPGGYTLRVLSTEPGGRALLRAFALTLDVRPPSIAGTAAAPTRSSPGPTTATGTPPPSP